jgi:hypothetical protein
MGKGIGILLDERTNDLKIVVKRDVNGHITGGVMVGNVTTQNQFVLLQAHTGELKNAPTTGVGIPDMLLDNNNLYWKTKVRETLEDEGLKIKTLEFTNNKINVNAHY